MTVGSDGEREGGNGLPYEEDLTDAVFPASTNPVRAAPAPSSPGWLGRFSSRRNRVTAGRRHATRWNTHAAPIGMRWSELASCLMSGVYPFGKYSENHVISKRRRKRYRDGAESLDGLRTRWLGIFLKLEDGAVAAVSSLGERGFPGRQDAT